MFFVCLYWKLTHGLIRCLKLRVLPSQFSRHDARQQIKHPCLCFYAIFAYQIDVGSAVNPCRIRREKLYCDDGLRAHMYQSLHTYKTRYIDNEYGPKEKKLQKLNLATRLGGCVQPFWLFHKCDSAKPNHKTKYEPVSFASFPTNFTNCV